MQMRERVWNAGGKGVELRTGIMGRKNRHCRINGGYEHVF